MTPFTVLICNKEIFHKGRTNIETWYFKITFDNVSSLVKHEIFPKPNLQIT